MRAFEIVAFALTLGLATACGQDGSAGPDDGEELGVVSAALCAEQRLTPVAATASSSEKVSTPPSLAVDGDARTRWSSAFADPQWIQLDLGAEREVGRVVLKWETAASKRYTLGFSDSESGPFTTVYSETNGDGGVDTISGLSAVGRYLRLTSTARTTGFGISLFEVEVYGDSSSSCMPVCGNSVVDTGEQCDDGNTVDGDGCSSACQLERSCSEHILPRVSATASSSQSAGFLAAQAIDGDPKTRWSSAFGDPQWIYVDLGVPRHVSRVNLRWETAASKSYQLQIADEGAGDWTTLYSDTNGNGGVDSIGGLHGTGRYVRLLSTQRTTGFGVSLFELEVLGDEDVTCGAAVEPPAHCGSVRLQPIGATASSSESSAYPPSEAIDGIVQTGCGAANRWSSAFSDGQWLTLDLGAPRHLDRVVLRWECAASASYDIQVASNATGPWATVYSDAAANGGVDDARGLNATARYVRLLSRARTTAFGISLYEMEVYGDQESACGARSCSNPTPSNTTSLVIASPSIGARVSTATLRSASRIAQNPVSKKVYVWADGAIRQLDLETLLSTPVVNGTAISAALPGGRFFTSVQGMAFGPEGNLYLVANEDHGVTNVALIVKGTPSADVWTWSLLAQTVEIPDSNTPFDHHWNGIVASPDGQYVFVASGSRTDHGEVQSQNGSFPGAREVPLTSSMFRLPTSASNLTLPNSDAGLASYVFAKGLRNSFDPAFAPGGELMAGDNGPDSDYNDELNWIRQGSHFGFPWRFGNEDNAMQFASYDPATDVRLRPGYYAVEGGFYYNDPAFPPKPSGLVDPLVSRGPDADLYRNAVTGGVVDASAVGGTISTFTGHRSPLGLSFDVAGRLCGDFKGQAFILSFGAGVTSTAANDLLPDPGRDLLGLRLVPVPGGFEIESHQLVSGFSQPIDSLLLGNKLYVIEYGPAGRVFELSLPVSG